MVKEKPKEWCVLKTGYFTKEDIVTFMECYWKSKHIENSTFKIIFFNMKVFVNFEEVIFDYWEKEALLGHLKLEEVWL